MKLLKIKLIITITLLVFTSFVQGQACSYFHKTESCKPKHVDNYRLTSLSHSFSLEVGTSITMDVVLYGENEILIQCCTEKGFYPIRFKIKSSENGKTIYDNKYNNYIDNLNLLLDHTEVMSIEISVEPNKKKTNKVQNATICIGLAIYMENTLYK